MAPPRKMHIAEIAAHTIAPPKPCDLLQLKYSGLRSSNSTLADKREFHSLLRGKQPTVVKKAN